MAARTITARDAGLALVSRINRWMIAGAIGFSGLISLVAAHAFHGRTVNASSAASSAAAPAQSPPSSSSSPLQQPSSAPSSPAPSAPAQSSSGGVVSGGS